MFVLTKENITEYLKKHMPGLDYSQPLVISAIGEGTEEEDGDGYLNFIYRVSDGKCNLVLKQGRSEGFDVADYGIVGDLNQICFY